MLFFHRGPEILDILDRRRQLAACPAHHASELLLRRGEKFPSLILSIGNDDIADHYVRCFELFRRLNRPGKSPLPREGLGQNGGESIGQS